MASKPHGLLLFFEGLPYTVIESQVFGLAEWLAKESIAIIDIMAVSCQTRLFALSTRRQPALAKKLSGDLVLRRGIRPALPMSFAYHRRLLRKQLATRRYDFVHARTDYAAAVAGPVTRAAGIPLIWDCRGYAPAELVTRVEAARAPDQLVRFRVRQLERIGEAAAQSCEAALFVSEPLRQKWSGYLGSRPTRVVPCVGDPTRFFFAPELREKTRTELGLSGDDILLVYSGALSAYQGFGETVRFMRELMQEDVRTHWLILTPDVEAASAKLDSALMPRCTVRHVAFGRVNDYLNAADCALMLRPECLVNTMAFPTKFAEFGLTGLPVIMTNTVPDCLAYARAAGNLIAAPAAKGLSAETERRPAVAAFYRKRLVPDAFSESYKSLYLSL